jgi:hypothetical protein
VTSSAKVDEIAGKPTLMALSSEASSAARHATTTG